MNVVKTIVIFIICVIIFVYFIQRRLMYFPSHEFSTDDTSPPFSNLLVSGNFIGYQLVREQPEFIVVFFHGNAGEAGHRFWIKDLIRNPKALVILAEYPGYGLREGSANQRDITGKMIELLDWLDSKYHLPVILLAESIGTGVAASVANHTSIIKLAFISPFISAEKLAQQTYPFLPVTLILKDTWRSSKFLRGLKLPLVVLHGELDSLIPPLHGRELIEKYEGEKKQFISLPGAGHNDIIPHILSSNEAEEFRNFINKK